MVDVLLAAALLLSPAPPAVQDALPIATQGDFTASGVHLLRWLPPWEFDATTTGNDCWGYVSPSGREYAILGVGSGTGFADVTRPSEPVIVGFVPGPSSTWRDIKTYQEYAYAVSEGGGGIQVIDLSQIDQGTVTLVNSVGSSPLATHNVAIDEVSGFLYRCDGSGFGGLRIYSLADPANPVEVGVWNGDAHDAQVVTYTAGPHAGRQIAYVAGDLTDDALIVLDVTDKGNIVLIDEVVYPNGVVSHQGWLSADRSLFYLGDESDEPQGFTTRTYVFDVADVDNPSYVGFFTNGNTSADHNLYVNGDRIYEANYTSGLRVFDASANPLSPVEIGFFDTHPNSDSTSQVGLWSNYPFFPSGVVVGSDSRKGLFVWWVGEPLLEFSFPAGVPTLVDPAGETLAFDVSEETPGELVPGSVTLHYDAGAGLVDVSATDLGGGSFEASLPPLSCGQQVAFHFTARSATGDVLWRAPEGPGANRFVATAGTSRTVFFSDDTETPASWLVGAALDDAFAGLWTNGDPVGTSAQPENDVSASGTGCWYTGADAALGTLGSGDVDGGRTTLFTPNMNMSAMVDPWISYWRWYSNVGGAAPGEDVFTVDITSNGGVDWVNVEVVGPTGPQAEGGWYRHTFRVADLVPPNAQVRMRFVADDDGSGSIVEAAIDEFELFDVCQPLAADDVDHSLMAGGAQTMSLDAGPGFAGELYWVFGSASGTAPGTPAGAFTIPLNVDFYTLLTVDLANQPPFVDTLGLLDGQGRATAQFALPAGFDPTLAGLKLNHAFTVLPAPSFGVQFVSNAVPLGLRP